MSVFLTGKDAGPRVAEREIMTFVFAPGAGASSSHPWMQRWAKYLSELGWVHLFDYPYQQERRNRPDPLPVLLAAHSKALEIARQNGSRPLVLIGKSMGARVGCHLALAQPVAALICLGYPLCGGGDRGRLRDQVLRDLTTPILFVQGTRDRLCPLDLLNTVRQQLKARNELHIVSGGDHSLLVTKTQLRAAGETQYDIDQQILRTIGGFLGNSV